MKKIEFNNTLPKKLPILKDCNDRMLTKIQTQTVFLLWKNRKYYASLDEDDLWFDYPDYGNLPKKISSRLSSDFVDMIQNNFYKMVSGRFKTLREFSEQF